MKLPCPIKPIYLIFLVVLVFYLVYIHNSLSILALIIGLFQVYHQYSFKKFSQVVVVLSISAILFITYENHIKYVSDHVPKTVDHLILIPDSLEIDGDLLSAQAKDSKHKFQVYYRLRTKREKQFFQQLDQPISLEIEGGTSLPQSKRNFNGFNYREYLKSKGIYRVISIKRIHSMLWLKKITWGDRLHSWRRKALNFCQKNFHNPMSQYMKGLLFGKLDKEFEEMTETYTNLGIIHLFALSGMEVNFFIKIFRRIFLRLRVRQDIVDGLQVAFSVIYAGLTGFSISVIRSLIQAQLARLGIQRFDNLAVTIALLFIFQPLYLISISGVLTCFYAMLLTFFEHSTIKRLPQELRQSVVLSVGILPILMFYFSSFHPFSIILTLVFSFLFDIVLLPILVVTFLMSPIVKLQIFNLIFLILEKVIVWCSHSFGKPIILGKPSLTILVVMLIGLAFLYDYWNRRQIRIQVIILLAICFGITKHPLTNEVTMIDVGQGDSILIRDYLGKTLLIDTGGKVTFSKTEKWKERHQPSNASKTLIPYLKSRGIGKIDQLVLTHTDKDHMGDVEEVCGNFSVGEILVSPGSLTQPSFLEILKNCNKKVRIIKAGDSLSIMGSQLEVLSPENTGDGGNNDSIVLYGKLLNRYFLFTGDLEKKGEEKLISQYSNLKVDILKVGHHGSKGSTSVDFLNHIKPKIALVSVGEHNRYHHPNVETLDRLRDEQVKVYRTDQNGAIRLIGFQSWKIEMVKN